jgi:1-deoxy-D-xylulose-5-phosphate reductoisomerase
MRSVALLGATGSIGASTLDVIRQNPTEFRLIAVSAGSNISALLPILREFRPAYVAIAHSDDSTELTQLPYRPDIEFGARAIEKLAELNEADIVVAAIVGTAGLLPTYAAIRAGKKVLLANKESLVAAGEIMMNAAARYGAQIIPIDSEHSAIFQCLHGEPVVQPDVKKLWLTASGGPFRTRTSLVDVTPAEAIRHPKWNMGPKISVDSATLMNKGLEVIEAHWLFAMSVEQIGVIIHPQSVVHSFVEFIDGTVLAQLGAPDMRVPISFGMFWPRRSQVTAAKLDLQTLTTLEFAKPDTERFPCLDLAYEALRQGGLAPAMLNAANEQAVAAFLNGRIAFSDIPKLVNLALRCSSVSSAATLDDVLAADFEARAQTDLRIKSGGIH